MTTTLRSVHAAWPHEPADMRALALKVSRACPFLSVMDIEEFTKRVLHARTSREPKPFAVRTPDGRGYAVRSQFAVFIGPDKVILFRHDGSDVTLDPADIVEVDGLVPSTETAF